MVVDGLKALDPNRPIREADSCTAAILSVFDRLVSEAKQRKRYGKAEYLSGFQMERWKGFLSTTTSSLMRCNNCALSPVSTFLSTLVNSSLRWREQTEENL